MKLKIHLIVLCQRDNMSRGNLISLAVVTEELAIYVVVDSVNATLLSVEDDYIAKLLLVCLSAKQGYLFAVDRCYSWVCPLYQRL